MDDDNKLTSLANQAVAENAAGDESPPPFAEERSPGRRLWMIFKVIEVRLRFIAILVITGIILVEWDSIKNHWHKWTRPDGRVYSAARASLGERAAHSLFSVPAEEEDSDTEYYCPMHPNVVRAHLDPGGVLPKCPICGMPLSPRKKGEVAALPPGISGRVQLSPERIQLAGIQTAEVGYQPLTMDINAVGYVNYDESRLSSIVSRVSGYIEKLHVDKTWITVSEGQPLTEIYSPELYSSVRELLNAQGRSKDLASASREKLKLLGVSDQEIDEIVQSGKANHRLVIRSPQSGHVTRKDVKQGDHVEAGQKLFEIADLSAVWIEAEVYEKDIPFSAEGEAVEARVQAVPNRVFRGKVSLVHPHLEAKTRTNMVRFELENPDHALRPGMFAAVTIRTPLTAVEPFKSLASEGPEGQLLAVPDRAVIDTGDKQIVYVERSPGLYEGVEVELGPATGGFYPVIKGLEAGERVAAAGAFLVDAETRLNPAAASTYMGAAGGPHKAGSRAAVPAAASSKLGKPQANEPSPEDLRNIAQLPAEDQKLAREQGFCPISGEPLGSMGVPEKITLKGQTVFLCCKGCELEAKKDPDETLRKVGERKAHKAAK